MITFKGNRRASDYGVVVKCNLCGMEFEASDSLFDARKTKHEEWHKYSTYLGRASKNTVFGKVEWIQV